jgi:hypothetical protein
LNNRWFIDDYGIQYPHDYPIDEDGVIVSNWKDFYPEVINKYKRRIERFKTILTSTVPIIALYFGPIKYALKIKKYIDNKYNKNIIFIVATYEKNLPYINNVIIINVINNEDSRKKEFWVDAINNAVFRIKNKNFILF